LLSERGVEFDTVEYLKNHPTREKLEQIVAMLEEPVSELVRKDKRFKELGLNADDYADKKSVIELLLKYPELMQRPIIIRGKRAIIARPPEKMLPLL
jgi:arsenate reductase (glutaredoxin)